MAVSSTEDTLDINLTPLLDLVLQLIMFFMACVNFASEALNLNVVLPRSLAAQEIQIGADEEQLIINIEMVRQLRKDAAGREILDPETKKPLKELVQPRTTRIVFANLAEVTFPNDQEQVGLLRAQRYLRDLAGNLKAVLRERRKIPAAVPNSEIKIPIPVIIRGDVETSHGLVLKLLAQCKAEGFGEVRLRVLQPG